MRGMAASRTTRCGSALGLGSIGKQTQQFLALQQVSCATGTAASTSPGLSRADDLLIPALRQPLALATGCCGNRPPPLSLDRCRHRRRVFPGLALGDRPTPGPRVTLVVRWAASGSRTAMAISLGLSHSGHVRWGGRRPPAKDPDCVAASTGPWQAVAAAPVVAEYLGGPLLASHWPTPCCCIGWPVGASRFSKAWSGRCSTVWRPRAGGALRPPIGLRGVRHAVCGSGPGPLPGQLSQAGGVTGQVPLASSDHTTGESPEDSSWGRSSVRL